MNKGFLNFDHLFLVFDLLSFKVPHIKDIRDLIPFGGDFSDSYIETEPEKGVGDLIESAHVIIGNHAMICSKGVAM